MKKNLFLLIILIIGFTSLKSQVNDYGMTSDAHGDHVGEIVFSKKPIQFQNENPDEFTNEFNYPEDKIYFMAYLPKSIANVCFEEHDFLPVMRDSKITFTFFVGDKEVSTTKIELTSDQLNKWTGWSDPNKPFGLEEGYMSKYCFDYRDYVLPELKKGENIIRMVVGYEVKNNGKLITNKSPVTEGTFTVIAQDDYDISLDPAPEAVMHDAALEAKVRKALIDRWDNTIVHKIILIESDWEVEYNSLDVPVCKVLEVCAITSPKDGDNTDACFAYTFQVKRDYLGAGKYNSKIVWYSSVGTEYEVDCE